MLNVGYELWCAIEQLHTFLFLFVWRRRRARVVRKWSVNYIIQLLLILVTRLCSSAGSRSLMTDQHFPRWKTRSQICWKIVTYVEDIIFSLFHCGWIPSEWQYNRVLKPFSISPIHSVFNLAIVFDGFCSNCFNTFCSCKETTLRDMAISLILSLLFPPVLMDAS